MIEEYTQVSKYMMHGTRKSLFKLTFSMAHYMAAKFTKYHRQTKQQH